VVVLVVVTAGGLTAIGVGPLASGGALGAPRFVEETATAGLAHTFGGDDTFDVGGGLAVFDCDGDGRQDVFVAGGGHPAALFRNESPTGGALRFTPVPSPVTDLVDVMGAYPLDVDGDGNVDLAVLRVGETVLLRGLGGCRFERADEAWGVTPAAAPTTAFSATWEGSNAMPTLAFGNYVITNPGGTYTCPDNQLFRPGASGTRYGPPITLSPGYCSLSMLFSDWDGSGRRDLRASNDRQYYDNDVGGEQLWRIEPGQAPRAYDAADGWALLRLWGMGIASEDVNGDGLPEVYLTTQGANTLQTLTSGPDRPAFHDIGLALGINATRPAFGGDPLPSTAWHPEFQDVNNDGLMDLFVTKGNVDQIPDYAQQDPDELYLGQPDGPFRESTQAAGLVSFDRGRGAAVADFNDDGLLDVVVVNSGKPVRLWRNVGSGSADAPAPMGGWLAVTLSQPGGNRDAIGSIIETKIGETVSRREVTVGGGHISGQLGWTHVGLGSAPTADVRVVWPDGETGPWMTVKADQAVEIARGASAPTTRTPPVG